MIYWILDVKSMWVLFLLYHYVKPIILVSFIFPIPTGFIINSDPFLCPLHQTYNFCASYRQHRNYVWPILISVTSIYLATQWEQITLRLCGSATCRLSMGENRQISREKRKPFFLCSNILGLVSVTVVASSLRVRESPHFAFARTDVAERMFCFTLIWT